MCVYLRVFFFVYFIVTCKIKQQINIKQQQKVLKCESKKKKKKGKKREQTLLL